MIPVSFAPEAEDEVAEAALGYEARRRGLAARFLNEVHTTADVIAERPKSFPRPGEMGAGQRHSFDCPRAPLRV